MNTTAGIVMETYVISFSTDVRINPIVIILPSRHLKCLDQSSMKLQRSEVATFLSNLSKRYKLITPNALTDSSSTRFYILLPTRTDLLFISLLKLVC
jgi:hypothetical protein